MDHLVYKITNRMISTTGHWMIPLSTHYSVENVNLWFSPISHPVYKFCWILLAWAGISCKDFGCVIEVLKFGKKIVETLHLP